MWEQVAGFMRPSAGLVLRTRQVELLALRGKRVTASARIPIEGDEPQALTEAIRRAVATGALGTTKPAVSIPTQNALFRCFTIPAIPKPEWETAVQFEARKYIPFKLEELVWDYRVMPAPAAKGLEVVFAAIQRDIFLRFEDALRAAGVEPMLVEPGSVSLARLVGASHGPPTHEFSCLVEIDGEVGHLAIVKHGTPYLTREINLSVVAGAPPTGAPEAEQPGTAEDRPAELDTQAQRRLLTELNVSMDFFLREYPSTAITRVVLFGEEPLVESWCRSLSGQLRSPVESGRPLLDRRISDPLPLDFASAVGVAQAGSAPRDSVIDLLRRSGQKAQSLSRAPVGTPAAATATQFLSSFKEWRAIALSGAVAGAILLTAWIAGAGQVGAVQHQLDQLIRSRPDVGWGLTGRDESALKPLQEKAAAQLALLRHLIEERLSVAELLDALARSLPDGVWLTGIAYGGPFDAAGKSPARLLVNGASFLGEAGQELSAIQQFEEHLRRYPKLLNVFSSAQLDRISVQTQPETQATYRTFQLNCQPSRRL
ncbi:MAG: pilus assembly protein PilM [Candidatus Omnitrophota bacterium]|nr:pilus assembly protein PilM [Candidatus Omnitrophota bacterium]